MNNRSKSIILILAGGFFVIFFTILAVTLKQNEPIDPEDFNMIALEGPGYEGSEIIQNDKNEDETYFIRELSEDGTVTFTNVSASQDIEDDEDYEDYMKRFISESVYEGAKITDFSQNYKISDQFTYPTYDAHFEAGSNEDSIEGKGIVFCSNSFIYFYGFSCPADLYEDYAEDFDKKLSSVEMTDPE
ncbi:MAG: hypothetical protein K6G22_01345 [Lachnospiraceae bacterium]|nr:hypothetical protein [Lachnospiraceae bacterium]